MRVPHSGWSIKTIITPAASARKDSTAVTGTVVERRALNHGHRKLTIERGPHAGVSAVSLGAGE